MGGDRDSGARRAGSGGERSGHASSAGAQAVRTLGLVTAALPHGEPRSGQADMAEAVAEAVVSGRHLVVQAGTGTGKSLAYLVPAILSGRPTVVATATRRCRTSWPPRTCRSSTSTSTSSSPGRC